MTVQSDAKHRAAMAKKCDICGRPVGKGNHAECGLKRQAAYDSKIIGPNGLTLGQYQSAQRNRNKKAYLAGITQPWMHR